MRRLLSSLGDLIGRSITQRPIEPTAPAVVTGLRRYTPAKGWKYILSERRQAQKQMRAQFTNLRSGRQWVKYRKAAQRLHKATSGERGFDFFSLPTYRVAA